MPIPLPALSFSGSESTAAFLKEHVDLTKDETWIKYANRVAGYDGISLSVAATNSTGSTANPSDVQLHFFISDRGDLAPDTLAAAVPLLDANLPGGMPTLQYDSGLVPISAAAGQLLRGGDFYLYVTGSPQNISLQTSEAHMNLKVRLSLL